MVTVVVDDWDFVIDGVRKVDARVRETYIKK